MQIGFRIGDNPVVIEHPAWLAHTPDEPWSSEKVYAPCYPAGAAFALAHLGRGAGRRCLVVGSTQREVALLDQEGWAVTFMDVRKPPFCVGEFVQGDMALMPFNAESFDAVSSTCVLCHVGLGRYDDPLHENGDLLALMEVARVLKPGGKASIMFGPSIPSLTATVTLGSVHRIYEPAAALELAKSAGLKVQKMLLWCRGEWRTHEEEAKRHQEEWTEGIREEIIYAYLSMLLTREGRS